MLTRLVFAAAALCLALSCSDDKASDSKAPAPTPQPVAAAEPGKAQAATPTAASAACTAEAEKLSEWINSLLDPAIVVERPAASPADAHLAALRSEMATTRRAELEGAAKEAADLNRPRGAPDLFGQCAQAAKHMVDIGQTEPGPARLGAYRRLGGAVEACGCNVDMASVRSVLFFMLREAPRSIVSGELPPRGLPKGFPMRVMPGARITGGERHAGSAKGHDRLEVMLSTLVSPRALQAYYRLEMGNLGLAVESADGVLTGSDARAAVTVKTEAAADGVSTNATLVWQIR